MTTRSWLPKREPHEPEDWDETVWGAVLALKSGTANQAQQNTVWAWMEYVTRTGDWEDMSYRPGGDEAARASAYADGKKHVGLQFKKMLGPYALAAVEQERRKKRAAQDASKPKRHK
jgi:hypothetical protein